MLVCERVWGVHVRLITIYGYDVHMCAMPLM
jgi:hypothetical protein